MGDYDNYSLAARALWVITMITHIAMVVGGDKRAGSTGERGLQCKELSTVPVQCKF